MATTTNVFSTTCSGCMERVTLNLDGGTVTATRLSNGRRGSLHVPAARLVADLDSVNADLACWECPLCGYADSFDLHYGERE